VFPRSAWEQEKVVKNMSLLIVWLLRIFLVIPLWTIALLLALVSVSSPSIGGIFGCFLLAALGTTMELLCRKESRLPKEERIIPKGLGFIVFGALFATLLRVLADSIGVSISSNDLENFVYTFCILGGLLIWIYRRYKSHNAR
jgi:hypothetical protein